MINKVGVYICHCGSNISDYVDVEKVKNISKEIEGVVLSKTTMFACADSTQKEIVDDIKNNKLGAIVIASCSPKLHLNTFRNVAIRAGLNPYNYVQVNIREQCSWAHSDKKNEATEKAIQLVKAGIARAKESKPLNLISIEAKNSILVIGAGISGMRSAIELARMGTKVTLIEKNHFIGGRTSQWNQLFTSNQTGNEIVTNLYNEIKKDKNITLYTGAELISKSGSMGNFEVDIRIKPNFFKTDQQIDIDKLEKAIEICPIEVDDPFNFNLTKRKAIHKNHHSEYPLMPVIEIDECNKCGKCKEICQQIDLEQKETIIKDHVGAILLATGSDPYEPSDGEFAYNEISNVITLQKFKRLIDTSNKKLEYNGKEIKHIAYIYCVGSRQLGSLEGENKYCSRYCCTSAIHTAILAKEKYKGIYNYHFTRGVRTYGKQEILYNKSNKQGDIFLQSDENSPPEVFMKNDQITVKINDILTANKELEVYADLVVLVTGMIPRKNDSLTNILKVPIGRDKFYNEIHPKLRPVETVIDGVFIAGTCQSPKNIMESLNSALSAATKANSLISKGTIELEPTLATIDESICDFCDKCIAVCPYDAIVKKNVNGKMVAEVIESNCKGCGMCLPVCPTNAIQLIGYTDIEIKSMIDALIF